MSKLKTYVLIMSERFPASHIMAGEPTLFINRILQGNKIHTIRSNYTLWEKRFKNVEKGEAVISLRVWSGKPYRSKQRLIKELTKSDGIGLEKLEWGIGDYPNLALNDGLLQENFTDWFKDADKTKPLAIIHFTKFRYN